MKLHQRERELLLTVDDVEAAHPALDAIYLDLLNTIAENKCDDNPAELAKQAVKLEKLVPIKYFA